MAKDTLDSPVEKNLFTPDGAEKMPTKHYPESSKMATQGKKSTIEGPCSEK